MTKTLFSSFTWRMIAISLTIALGMLSMAASAQDKLRCKGLRKDGTACQSTIVSKSTGYCNAHNPNATRCGFLKKDGNKCKMVVKATGERCRFHKG